jgi:alanyl-tRNA synthetase
VNLQAADEERTTKMDERTQNHAMNNALAEGLERLTAAAGMLERAAGLLEERHASMTGEVARIVATVEQSEGNQRQAELERKLREAEEQIAELKAQAVSPAEARVASTRKTLPLATTQLLAKQGVHSVDGLEAGALDAALTGLSLEQRIAVKAQLIRTGALA